MTEIKVWDQSIPRGWLPTGSVDYLSSLPKSLPTVEWVWREMDRVWEHYALDNRKSLAHQRIGDFYNHPVWLMNGIFTQLDPISTRHRASIAQYLAILGMTNNADYGGGFGELALAMTRVNPIVHVSIIEPYPSRVGTERLKNETRIRFERDLGTGGFDAVVAQDVLEHVEDPVHLAYQIAYAVREGGIAVFANCFFPVIQCHVPSTFHLRHTFPWVMRAMGLRYMGRVGGAAHAQVFQRSGPVNLNMARSAEHISRLVGPALNSAHSILEQIKHLAVGR